MTSHVSTQDKAHTHIQVYQGARKQNIAPHNSPHPRNNTLLHKFVFATTQILEYTPTL